ncbi:alpha/beta hydrolase [Microbulbifer aggregans]|uniref:alpha/beta hydrolase n=1 Tax=Microbulbifer aggregans TaxID=1769779 RepID=UPI001CFEC340|nr:alpha/beta hydrolase-fold protein [Microbulbifer aggregans]
MTKSIAFIFSFLVALNSTASEAPTKTAEVFTIYKSDVFSINSEVLNRKYELYIKLPFGYTDEENQENSYPVLYLNDGPYTFKVAAGVTHYRSMDKAIVVGISFAQGENGQASRVRDLTPVTDKSWVKFTTGGAPDYLEFIEEEVIPFIEKNYRADPEKRILSGQSLGGSFGAWVLLTKPQLFSSYILTSPSLWYKDDVIFEFEEKYAKQHNSLNVNLFIATGALETPENSTRENLVDDHQRFVARLRARNYKNIRIGDEIVSGTDHFSTFPVGLAKGLRWIYQDIWGH